MKRLSDIDLEEVSLVDIPAIKRKFLIVKQEDKLDNDLTIEAEVEKKLSDKAANAVKGALKILSPYKDEFTGKIKNAVDALAEASGYGYPEGEYAKPKKEAEKAGRKISKDTKEKLQSIIRELTDLISEAEDVIDDAKKETKKSDTDLDEILSYVKDKAKEIAKK